ncbi:uncharacterized protein LOC132277858 [Cornus florida]|uniref:uncharacterized protein LOC132277858 n=1 Tax=Cornus florida TaxID=4283 RepID=UPI00289A33DD|nr:uncharacterized protein LOC132277858 [Cornus florida]
MPVLALLGAFGSSIPLPLASLEILEEELRRIREEDKLDAILYQFRKIGEELNEDGIAKVRGGGDSGGGGGGGNGGLLMKETAPNSDKAVKQGGEKPAGDEKQDVPAGDDGEAPADDDDDDGEAPDADEGREAPADAKGKDFSNAKKSNNGETAKN